MCQPAAPEARPGMTGYYAAVKYPLDATREQKIAALRDGLRSVAVELVEEWQVPLEDVEHALDDAYSYAELSAETISRESAP